MKLGRYQAAERAEVLTSWKTVGGHRRIAVDSVQDMLRDRDAVLKHTAGDKISVMVVEDHADTAALMQSMLDQLLPTAEMRLARDGFSALIDAGMRPPEMLITDINLPGLDGVEMLRALKLHPGTQKLRVVFITNHSPGELERFGPLPSGVPVLRKPIQIDDLRRALQLDRVGA